MNKNMSKDKNKNKTLVLALWAVRASALVSKLRFGPPVARATTIGRIPELAAATSLH